MGIHCEAASYKGKGINILDSNMSARDHQNCRDRAATLMPWSGGPKLISLADMHEYLARRLIAITENIVNAQCSLLAFPDQLGEDETKTREGIRSLAKDIFTEASFLALPSTKRQAQRLYYLTEKHEAAVVDGAATELDTRFHEETELFKLFYIPNDKLEFYNKTDLFGEQFKTNFPSANVEVIEAGNCFAFDRFTACAFHLMRSLEVVLKTLFAALGLPPLTTTGDQNWNGILRQIKDKLDADKTIQDHAFYDGAYAFLAAAKNPMRNATMHVDAVYDEPSVKVVFDAIGAFMRHVATKSKEAP